MTVPDGNTRTSRHILGGLALLVCPQMLKKPLRARQKIAHQRDVLEVVEIDMPHWGSVEAQNPGSRNRHQDRGVRRNQELGSVVYAALDHRQKRQLALRREGGFRLIQQVEALGHQARPKQLKKALAMRARVEALSVAVDITPDIVFINYDMTPFSGRELSHVLAAVDSLRGIHIVLLTSYEAGSEKLQNLPDNVSVVHKHADYTEEIGGLLIRLGVFGAIPS